MQIEVQHEEIQTPHGIFTSNTYLGLTAQEVYEKWLYDKENKMELEINSINHCCNSFAYGYTCTCNWTYKWQ